MNKWKKRYKRAEKWYRLSIMEYEVDLQASGAREELLRAALSRR